MMGNRRDLLLGALLAALAAVLYAPALGHGLVGDDAFSFAGHPQYNGLRGLWTIWTTRAGLSCPLTLSTCWLIKQVAGLTPWVFHLAALALHAANAVLAWALLRQLRVRGAWLAAALFAVHPLQVESVAWIPELPTTQSAFFFLVSLLALERGRRASGLLLFACALLSKASAVMLPAVALLLAWWRAAAGGDSSWGAVRTAGRGLRALLPLLLLALLAGGWTLWGQMQGSGLAWAHGWRLRGAVAGQGVWFYFFKFLWPHPLCFVYPRWIPDVTQLAAFLPAGTLAGLLACLWFVPARWARHALAGVGFFLLVLFPVLGFFNLYPSRYAFVADHFAYLALLGPCALAGALVSGLPAPARRLAAALLVTGLAAVSQQRVPAFCDEPTLWADTLAKNPGAQLFLNEIGAAHQSRGDLAGARWFYEEALRRQPDHIDALVNLGSVLLDQNEPAAALTHYERALRLKPDNPLALVNLGLALARQGRAEEALARFGQALAVRPDFLEAHVKAAGVLEQVGRFDDAATAWRAALKLKRVDAAAAADFFRQRAAEFDRLQVPAAAAIYRRAAGSPASAP